MNIERQAKAQWMGDLMSGKGQIKLGSNAFEGPYSFKGRTTEASSETNPEELIGAALAGCFSMQLSALLTKAGHVPESIDTTAKVLMTKDSEGISVSKIDLVTTAKIPGISTEEFSEQAETAKKICPISKALAATNIELSYTLL